MTALTENPLPIILAGGLLSLVALLVFLARRNFASLVALVGVLALTLLLVLVERFVVTDREQVEAGVDEVFAAIEANDAAGVVAWIDPEAKGIRDDVEKMMPLIDVIEAHAMGATEVTLDETAGPPRATARFKAFLQGVHKSSGQQVPYINQQVDVEWIKREDRWLIDGYTAYFDGKPIDAVGSARSNRPVGAR